MKWVDIGDGRQFSCRVSDDLVASVWEPAPDQRYWYAAIDGQKDEQAVFEIGPFTNPSDAKSAVAAWIGKTIAQLGNAVAAGETFPDDGA